MIGSRAARSGLAARRRRIDFASYVSAPVGVTASLHSQNLNTGHAAGDDYHSVEGLRLVFDDALTGDIGHNGLDGRAGNDTLRSVRPTARGGLGEAPRFSG